MQPTTGTHLALWLNGVIGILAALQGMDWVHLIGSNGGWVRSSLALANAVAHAVTGNSPIIAPRE
jgi:hypothetical protein